MICPKCGQEYPDTEPFCPACGGEADVNENEVPELPEEAEPVAGTEAAPDSEAEETSAQSADPEDISPEAPAPAVSRDSGRLKPGIVAGAVALLAIIIGVCTFAAFRGPAAAGSDGSPRDVAVQVLDDTDTVLEELTNEQLSFYYWGEFYYLIQSYGQVMDLTVPLSEQNFSDEQTWQDYLLENACTSIRQIAAIKAAAAAEGFTMPEDYRTEYDQTLSSLQEFAASAGFVDPEGNGDVLAYVQDSYGEAATVEDFESYLYDSYYVTAYSDFVYDGLSATEQEISDYYDENAEMYEMYGMARSETPDINVRHILIQPETSEEETGEEEARDAAREEAERIYQLWLDGDATEESFAELAGEYSQDGGSMDAGGLYENVYPGQMVTEFDEWCFDPDRKVGDTGIVETDYGFHIMYFSGLTDHYTWQEAVEGDLLYEKYSRFMEDLTGSCHTVITENVSLPTPAAVQTLAEEAAAQTAAEAEPEPT